MLTRYKRQLTLKDCTRPAGAAVEGLARASTARGWFYSAAMRTPALRLACHAQGVSSLTRFVG